MAQQDQILVFKDDFQYAKQTNSLVVFVYVKGKDLNQVVNACPYFAENMEDVFSYLKERKLDYDKFDVVIRKVDFLSL